MTRQHERAVALFVCDDVAVVVGLDLEAEAL